MRKVVIKFDDRPSHTCVWDARSGDPLKHITKMEVKWSPGGETIAYIEEYAGIRRKDGSIHLFRDSQGRTKKNKYKALVVPNFDFGDTD